MRCPECAQRNSVAASKCKFCGVKMRKKTASPGKAFAAIGAVSVIAAIAAGTLLLPKLADPGENLSSCAKRLAAGPKSADDAKHIKTEFDKALQAVLQKFGDDNSTRLAARLQAMMPSTAFEVHVVDLPRSLKLVEIDTLLQAADFLVMKGTTETKVFPLPDFEVFDDAKAVNDQAGPVLVLLGHSSGQMPHKPLVKTYALLPDYIVDETEKMVPLLKGEGTAKFMRNSADVVVDMSVASMAKEEKVAFSSPLPADLSIKQRLHWSDAKFVPEYDLGNDANAYLFMVGRCLARPELVSISKNALGEAAANLVKKEAGDGLGEVAISSFSSKKAPVFALRGKQKEFLISIAKTASKWEICKFTVNATKPDTHSAVANNAVDQSQQADPVVNAATAAAATIPPAAPIALTAAITPVAAPQTIPAVARPETAPAVITVRTSPSFAPSSAPVAPVAALQEQSRKQTATNGEEARNSEVNSATDSKERESKLKQRQREDSAAKEEKAKEEKAREEKKAADSHQLSSAKSGHQASVTEYLSSPSIRLRSRPALNGEAVTDIPKGAKITVHSKENGWYKVSYNGQTGYVYGGLVEFKKHPTSPAPSPAYATAIVTRAWTVRDEHRKPLARPQKGDRLVILGGINKNNKYKVQLSDGRVGYLDKSAVDVKVDTPEFVP